MVYDLGGVVIDRCPLALMKHPWTQTALRLFGAYRHGLTPNGRGLRQESAHYQVTMGAIEALTAEAEAWYMKQKDKPPKK